jgi:endoglucanase
MQFPDCLTPAGKRGSGAGLPTTSAARKSGTRTIRVAFTIALTVALSFAIARAADTDIRYNSLGFLPDHAKRAAVTANCSSFTVRRASDDVPVFPGSATGPVRNQGTGEDIWTLDFSSYREPGIYYLDVPGVGRTPPFPIGEKVYDFAYYTVMRGFYLWRCGMGVEAHFRGNHYRTQACHLNDASQLYTAGVDSLRDGTGGWHDAGDFGKYVVNTGVTLGLLLKAWEHFQPRIEAVPLDLPDSEAALPDFLKEIKWETDWLLKMQYPDGSGRVSHKLTRLRFANFVMPQDDLEPRYFTTWSSAATASFAAMMAMAARAFEPYDVNYSARCLKAAEGSYAFLRANPAEQPFVQGDFATGEYGSGDSDDRLWAAAEIWETTGDQEALADVENRIRGYQTRIDTDFDWGNVKNLGVLTYLESGRSGRDQALVTQLEDFLTDTADLIVRRRDADTYGRALTNYYWGCNGSVARQTLLLQTAYRIDPKPEYLNTALDAIGHLFGRNTYGRSYVTGLGINPPLHPHDRRSGADGIGPPWPGYLVGGGHTATGWRDVQADYETNEIAINWQAALVYALAGFLSGEGEPAVFPQLALGGGYRCIILLGNRSGQEWQGSLRTFRGNQVAWTVSFDEAGGASLEDSDFVIAVPPRATRKVLVTGGSEPLPGYMTLSGENGSSPADLAVSLFYNFLTGEKLADSTGIPVFESRSSFTLPVEYSRQIDTGFAWALPDQAAPFTIRLNLWDAGGDLVGSEETEYLGHNAQFFTEVFGPFESDFLGRLEISSDRPIYLTTLRLEYTNGGFQLTSTPAQ